MKLKKSELNAILALLGIGVAALTYFNVYKNFNEKTDTYNAQNAVLEQEVGKLQELADHQAEYAAETDSMNEEIIELNNKFDAFYLPEDEILYVDGIEKSFDATMATISMPGSQGVAVAYSPSPDLAPINISSEVAPVEEAEAADALEGEEVAVDAEPAPAIALPDIQLSSTPVAVTYVASYNSIKDLLKAMNEDNMRKSIDSLTMAFDGETGDITGGLAFNMYSISGGDTDKTYEAPRVDGVMFGTSNLFNTSEKKAAIQSAKAAEAE